MFKNHFSEQGYDVDSIQTAPPCWSWDIQAASDSVEVLLCVGRFSVDKYHFSTIGSMFNVGACHQCTWRILMSWGTVYFFYIV